MKILTYTSLYPNSIQPSHGIFVERRLQKLCAGFDVDAAVVAPVPWFPLKSKKWGRYSVFARVPLLEQRNGIEISHPRFPVVPKVGAALTPATMTISTASTVSDVGRKIGGIDLIDAHYFFPDGVAAGRIAAKLNVPFVVTARGSDINLIAQSSGPRRAIRQTAKNAAAVIAVSQALANEMECMGIAHEKIHVLRNGVDLNQFRPTDREKTRRKLGIDGPVFISVGQLKEAKGHHIAIEMLLHLNTAILIIVGSGEYEKSLKDLVSKLDLERRVFFEQNLNAEELCRIYSAADALVLMSRREGLPNVVLESIACGTPVIATDVGGIREVIDQPGLGELVNERSSDAAVNGWRALEQRGVDKTMIRKLARAFSWEDTSLALHNLMTTCVSATDERSQTHH